jgi:hypothetical protein
LEAQAASMGPCAEGNLTWNDALKLVARNKEAEMRQC